ncbi:hypothetical protein Tco_1511694, partial [Tanacetum coccineum]
MGIGGGLEEHLAPMECPDKIPLGIKACLGHGLLTRTMGLLILSSSTEGDDLGSSKLLSK